jgi:hypothetical protein
MAFPVGERVFPTAGKNSRPYEAGSYERIGIRPKYTDARGVRDPAVRLGYCV